MIVREVMAPAPRRPSSARDGSRQPMVAAPKRPSSARSARGVREQVQKARENTVGLVHGSVYPAPDGEAVAGPGQFRIYASDSKFMIQDPLNTGEESVDVAQRVYAMGPNSNTKDLSSFRVLDISKLNGERHNWQRLDTFQTPAGHLSGSRIDTEAHADPENEHTRWLEAVRREIRESIRSELQASVTMLREDFAMSVNQTVDDIKTELKSEMSVFSDALNQEFDSFRERESTIDFSPVFQKIDECNNTSLGLASLLEQVQHIKAAVLKSLWEHKSAIDTAQILEEVRKVKLEIDFSEVLSALSTDSEGMKRTCSDLLQELQRVNMQVEALDISKVQSAIQGCQLACVQASRDNRAQVNLEPVLLELKRVKAEVDKDFLALVREIRTSRQEIDFKVVIQAIQDNRTEIDYQRILRAISDCSAAPDMTELLQRLSTTDQKDAKLSTEIAELKDAISRRLEVLDFSPVLQAVRDNRVDVDLSGVTSEVSLVRSQVEALAKELTEERRRTQHVDVDFSTVLDAIAANRPRLDFTEVLTCVRENRTTVDFTEVFEAISACKPSQADYLPLIQEIRKIKGAFDFSQVLEAISQSSKSIRSEVSHAPILNAVRDLQAKVDASSNHRGVLQELGKVASKVDKWHAGSEKRFDKMQDALSSTLEELRRELGSDGMSDQILEAVRGLKAPPEAPLKAPEADVPERRSSRKAPETQRNSMATEIAKCFDLSEVLREIRSVKKEIDFSPVMSSIKQSTQDVARGEDLRSCLDAVVQAGKDELLRGGLTAVLEEVRGHASLVLQAVHDSEERREKTVSSILRAVAQTSNAVHDSQIALEDTRKSTSTVLTAIQDSICYRPQALQQELRPFLAAVEHIDEQVIAALEAKLGVAGSAIGNWSEVLGRLWDTHQQMAKMSAEHESAMLEMQRIAGLSPGQAARSIDSAAAVAWRSGPAATEHPRDTRGEAAPENAAAASASSSPP